MAHKAVIALIAGVLPGAALADDYVGTLRAPQSTLNPAGTYSFATAPDPSGLSADSTHRFKLGYKPSRYFAVEGEVVEILAFWHASRGTPPPI